MKEAYKGFSVYKDFIKDLVYLMLIVQALGGISTLLASSDWTFANTVSIHYFKSKNCITKGLIISEAIVASNKIILRISALASNVGQIKK